MRDAVIVSTARTPIGKAYRGAFNNLEAPSLAAHAVKAALDRAGLSGGDVEEAVFGSALTQGTSGVNVARHVVQAAALPDSLAGATVATWHAGGDRDRKRKFLQHNTARDRRQWIDLCVRNN